MAAGVVYCFDLRGATGVSEDRLNDYRRVAGRAGTDLWVGEHVGSVDAGGAYWGPDGVLYDGGLSPSSARPVRRMYWSFNHEHPALAELLVALFTWQGFDAWWSGEAWDSVEVDLERPRGLVGSGPAPRPLALPGQGR